MVDVVNNIELVKPKMINQMRYNRQIYSLDEMIYIISQTDPTLKGFVQINDLDKFLGTLGIFLKSQEQTELSTYLGKTEQNQRVSIEKFIKLFKMEPPKNLNEVCKSVFNKLKNENDKISVEKFWSSINLKKHPLVKLYKRPIDYVKPKMENLVRFVIGKEVEFGYEQFLQLYLNAIYLMPIENVSYFIKYIPELYDIQVEDFQIYKN